MSSDEAQRELLGRLLAAQQQVIDLRARLDREHQAGEGFRRFSERVLAAEALDAFWDVATEEIIGTFGAENAILVRFADHGLEICATCCVDGIGPEHLAELAPVVDKALRENKVVLVHQPLPRFVGVETAVLLVGGFRDRQDGNRLYAAVASVSAAKAPFYPTFDDGIGPLYAAFTNHIGALQQHLRSRIEARKTEKQMTRLADVASRTSNAVVIANREGGIEWVNDGFVRMTGYTLDEVIGKPPGTFLQGPSTDQEARRVMRESVAAFRPFDVEVSNSSKDGRQYYVQIESRVTYDAQGEPTGFIAIETDVTERRIAARRDGLAQRIAALLLASNSKEVACHRLVRELVEELDVVVAQTWSVEPGAPALVYSAGACAPHSGALGQAFLDVTRSLEYRPGSEAIQGVGLPGCAWGTGKVAFIRDLTLPGPGEHISRRLEVASEAGLHTVCAVPIRGPRGVLGVMEVGSPRGHPINDLLPSILERVAEQVAAFMLHDMSRRAFRTIFDQSPDGLLLVNPEGHVEEANARAQALFGEALHRRVEELLEGGFDLARSILAPAPTAATSQSDGQELFHRKAHGALQEFSAEVSASGTSTESGPAAILAVRDLTERHRMEAAITQSLREKETLLKEIHHRVKNNLQIISSLLMLQVDQMPTNRAKELLEESVHRVRSMALIHQQLYGALSLERIDFLTYARQLTESLRGALAPSARLRVEGDGVEMTVEQAVPLGLVLNELVTNALKYGVGPEPDLSREADVIVELHAGEVEMELSVRDFGPGLPAGLDVTKVSSLGLQLVRSLTKQLHGRLEVKSDAGAVFRLTCPRAIAHTSSVPRPASA